MTPCHQHGPAPLTFLQQARLERARQAREAGAPARSNLVIDGVSVTGALDLGRLARALAALGRRQPALRSRFADDHQVLAPCRPERPASLVRGAELPAELPPDGPDRYALAVERVGPDRHLLRLAADHLVFDGRSLELFWQQLWAGYADVASTADPDGGCRCEPGYRTLLTAAPRRPDADRERTERLVALLRHRDSPFGFVDLPVTLPLEQVGSRRVSVLSQPLADRLAARVAETARSRRATVFAVVTAAVLAALGDLDPASAPMLYTYLENRAMPGARTAIGWFAGTALLVDEAPAGGRDDERTEQPDELARAKSLLLDALLHGARRTEDAHRAAGAGPRPATLPSISLSQGALPRNPTAVAGLTVTPLAEDDEPTGTVPRGRIALEYWPDRIEVSYETDRFAAATVRALADAVHSRLVRLAE